MRILLPLAAVLFAFPCLCDPPNIDSALSRLRDADPKTRQSARDDLLNLAAADLSDADALRLLRASADPFPDDQPPSSLLSAAGKKPLPAFAPIIRALSPRASHDLKSDLLTLLLKIEDRRASSAYVQLLDAWLPTDAVNELNTAP